MPVHRAAIANYCTAFLDSNILLHFTFDEAEFREKIEFFTKTAAQYKLVIEILPNVNYEVTKRLMIAADGFATILRNVCSEIESATKNKIALVPADKDAVRLLEQAVDSIIISLRKLITTDGEYERAVRQARAVEAALIRTLYDVAESGKSVSLGAMIKSTEEEFAKSYVDYSDRLSRFVGSIHAHYIGRGEILPSHPLLENVLRSNCGLRNECDVKILCQAICRMFHQNRWCALVALDYSDLIHNKTKIESETLLLVCDPMYVFAGLDARLELTFSPVEEARRRKLQYTNFVDFPKPVGVI